MRSKPFRTDFLANLERGWGDDPPLWVAAIARECERTSATAVAKKLGFSVSVISGVVLNNYPGDMRKVQGMARGVLLSETVECPVLGEIERDRCEREQSLRHFGTSAMRTRIYRACRSGCPNSRLKTEGDDVSAP